MHSATHAPPPPPPASLQGVLASFAGRGQEGRTRVDTILPASHAKGLTAKQGIHRSKRGWGALPGMDVPEGWKVPPDLPKNSQGQRLAACHCLVHGVAKSQNRTERLSLSPIVNRGQLIISTSRRLTGTSEKIDDFPSLPPSPSPIPSTPNKLEPGRDKNTAPKRTTWRERKHHFCHCRPSCLPASGRGEILH